MKTLLDKLDEAAEIADYEAFDEDGLSKVQDVLDECRNLVRACILYNAAPDDAEFEPPHPIFKMASDIDTLRRKLAAAMGYLTDDSKALVDDVT